MNCADIRSLLGGYVLHALEPHEEEAVRRHIGSCPDCARTHAELEPVPALLDVAVDPEGDIEDPPASLEEAVLDRFVRERTPSGSRGRRPRRRLRAPGWLARPLPAAGLAPTADRLGSRWSPPRERRPAGQPASHN